MDTRLALIGEAINDVAQALADEAAGVAVGELTSRLAGIWAMVADLDPALAASLPGYIHGVGQADESGVFTADGPETAARAEAGG